MTTKKWLNIVLDGNSALSPYWSKIVSEYLEKIVRSFFDNSREEGVNSCELGLIMYNANSDLGLDVQYINWTTDVDFFLGMLSCLAFNGDNVNQHTLAEGLAEALVMFPRNRMTVQEYFQGERHCILVATGDPVPKRMLVSLPMVQEGRFVEAQLKPLNANFLEVAKMFGPLGVTLSIITPKQHPMFTEIFNLGNNDSLMVNTPVIDYGIGQFTVLFSRNFKEAHNALYKRGTVDSLPTIFANDRQENLFPATSMTIGEQGVEGVQNVRLESAVNTLSPVIPPATTDEIHVNVPSPGCALPMNVFDDIMVELSNDNDIFVPRKKHKTFATILGEETLNDLFQPDQPIPLDDTLGQEQTQVLRDIAAQIVTEDTTSTIAPGFVSKASTSTAGEGSSRGNMGVVNPILSSGNSSNSSLLLPQNNTNLWPRNSTTVRLGTNDPPRVGASFGNSTGTSQCQFQSCSSPSFPVIPYGSSHQQFPRQHRFEMTGISPQATTAMGAMMPQYNQRHFWPLPPSLPDFKDFVHAWQGFLVGKIHSNRTSLNQAKALRRPTSPVTLTVQWSNRLEIALFLPEKAVNHTMRICGGPIDYVFFHMTHFNNLDLYDHLMSKNLCAKIELPSQTLILSTTESKHHYLGTLFPGDTVFVEPL